MVTGKMGNVFHINWGEKVILKDRASFKKEITDFDDIYINQFNGSCLIYLPNPCIIRADMYVTKSVFSTGAGRGNFTNAAQLKNVNFNFQGKFFDLYVPFYAPTIIDIIEAKDYYHHRRIQISPTSDEIKVINGKFLLEDGVLKIPHFREFDFPVIEII